MLGSMESVWAEKRSSKKLIDKGSFTTVELLASTIKEVMSCAVKPINDTEVTFVLHHSMYVLFRVEIPLETDKTAYHVFLKEQFIAKYPQNLDEFNLEMFVKEFENKKYGFVYAFPKKELTTIAHALDLLDLKLVAIVPEHLAYYTLFERALRLDKHEHILYAQYENETLEGYYFDTFGPLAEVPPWTLEDVKWVDLEATLNRKTNEYATKVAKLNRLVISGKDSDKIRQDTFTKNVGVWTNPLKRIIPNFYQEYITLIQGKVETDTIFPVLSYSDVFGCFICIQDSKTFPYSKSGSRQKTAVFQQPITHLSNDIPMTTTKETRGFRFPKEIVLFIVIFLVTFGIFYFVANGKGEGGKSFLAFGSPTETPTPSPTVEPPSPTPTVEVKRDIVKVKVLNGTGVAGQANGMKTLLQEKGYVGVLTGNASKYDYTQTEVQIKKEQSFLEATILSDIKDIASSPKISELDSTDSSDVVIIIGKDVK